jgi:acyl-CoA reductase-like NAD-dependent aldehyde dehydrogenase
VLNVVCGDRDTGRVVVAHPAPQFVSITGSTRAGMEPDDARIVTGGKQIGDLGDAARGLRSLPIRQGLSMYGFEEYTRIKHVMSYLG